MPLLPQAEKLSDAGVQVAPPGIHLVQLPFADDMRELGVDSTLTVMRPYGTSAASASRSLAKLSFTGGG